MLYSALIGHPVSHSISPLLFSRLSLLAEIEYSHIKIDVPESHALGGVVAAMVKLGFSGANVTLPYKVSVLDSCEWLSADASKMGAVNCLRFEGGKVYGYNTDGEAALRAIESKWRNVLPSDKVLVFGSGGAARAIIYALSSRVGKIVVIAKDMATAAAMSEHLGHSSKAQIQVEQHSRSNLAGSIAVADLVVNATPVGMSPQIDNSIVPIEALEEANMKCEFGNKCFFDAVFNPPQTKMLYDGARFGATVSQGIFMLIHQALLAFEIWTGLKLSMSLEEIDSLSDELCAIIASDSKHNYH